MWMMRSLPAGAPQSYIWYTLYQPYDWCAPAGHSCSLLISNLSNSHLLPLMHSMRTHCTYVQFDFGLVRLALLLEPHTLTLISREPAYSELYPHLLVSRTFASSTVSKSIIGLRCYLHHPRQWVEKKISNSSFSLYVSVSVWVTTRYSSTPNVTIVLLSQYYLKYL